MSQRIYELMESVLKDYDIPFKKLDKALTKYVKTLDLFINDQLYKNQEEKEQAKEAIRVCQDFIIQLELCNFFQKMKGIRD